MTVTTLVFLFLAVTPVWGQDAAAFYNLGLNSSMAYKKTEYFTRAIQLDPNVAAAYEQRAMNYYFQRQFGKAIQDYNRFIALEPQHAHAYLMRGSAYLNKEKGGGIKTEFSHLVSHLKYGRRKEPGKLLDRAIDDLSRAIELGEQGASAFSYRAEAYRIKGMIKEALADATLAAQMEGNQRSVARAYSTRAKIYLDMGEMGLYEANYRKSVELDPFFSQFPPLHVPLFAYDTADIPAPKTISRLGLISMVVLALVIVFKLTIPLPNKKD